MRLAAVTAVVLGLIVVTGSHTRGEECLSPGTTILFVNGILNDGAGAEASLRALSAQVGNSLHGECIDFARIYVYAPVPSFDPTKVAQHVAHYREELAKGNKVVVVAHSNGNFYANAAYERLTMSEQASVGIVAVASIDDHVAGNGAWTSLDEDIFAVSYATHMAPNATNGGICGLDFVLCHKFVESYLDGPVSGQKIIQDITGLMSLLARPPGGSGVDWPMFQHDSQHTGHAAGSSITVPLTQRWTYPAPGRIVSSPAIANGVVYFGSSDGQFHAVDAIQKTPRWPQPFDVGGSTLFSAAAVWGDRVYVVSAGNASVGLNTELHALDSSTGEEVWAKQLGPPSGAVLSAPVLFDGVVYVGSSGSPSGSCPAEKHKVYAIDAMTGDIRPQWPVGIVDPHECRKDVLSSPAVTEDTVVVGTWGSCFTCPTVFAFDRLSATPKWSAIVYSPYVFPAPSAENGVVYVRSGGGGNSGSLIALDEQTGTQVWQPQGIGNPSGWGSPAIADGVVYTSDLDTISAFDAATGQRKWAVPATRAACNSPYVSYSYFAVANSLLFIKAYNGSNACPSTKVYALNTSDGSLLWDSGLLSTAGMSSGEDRSTPVVVEEWLYFAAGSTLYAYGSAP